MGGYILLPCSYKAIPPVPPTSVTKVFDNDGAVVKRARVATPQGTANLPLPPPVAQPPVVATVHVPAPPIAQPPIAVVAAVLLPPLPVAQPPVVAPLAIVLTPPPQPAGVPALPLTPALAVAVAPMTPIPSAFKSPSVCVARTPTKSECSSSQGDIEKTPQEICDGVQAWLRWLNYLNVNAFHTWG